MFDSHTGEIKNLADYPRPYGGKAPTFEQGRKPRPRSGRTPTRSLALRPSCFFFRKKAERRAREQGHDTAHGAKSPCQSKDTTLNDWQASFVSATRIFLKKRRNLQHAHSRALLPHPKPFFRKKSMGRGGEGVSWRRQLAATIRSERHGAVAPASEFDLVASGIRHDCVAQFAVQVSRDA